MLSDTALVITAWKRPDYLRRTLGSWAVARHAGELRTVAVALGRSHRFDDQVDVIRRAEEVFDRKIVILPDSPEAQASPGMHRALGEAVDRVFDSFAPEWVLCGEEDVVVSDDVLDYMSWAQAQYIYSRALCICAHNRGGAGWDGLDGPRLDGNADQEAVRLLPYFNPWVWCTWRDRWKSVIRPAWDWGDGDGRADATGYDWSLQGLTAAVPWRNLVPDAARSQTIGEFAGVYSTPEMLPLQQSQSFREHREPVKYRLADE
jgi:hypothetical protein